MALATSLLASVLATLIAFSVALPAVVALGLVERFGPVYGQRPTLAAQVKGVLFQVVSLSVGTVIVSLIWRVLPIRPHPAWPGLALPAALLISDCLQYWEHRLEHWLFWRVHAVHHSTRELTGASNVNHFVHNVFMALIYGVPMSLIARDPMAGPIVVTLVYVWAAFIHSPAKLSIGPLRYVFADNRIHRVHHALDARLHDRNFGAILTLWDVLFGTIYWPKKDEWPDPGVADYGEIDTVSGVLLRPFLLRQR